MRSLIPSLVALTLLPVSASSVAAHSGGLDANGCHAGSRPYHCHRGGSSAPRTPSYQAPRRVYTPSAPVVRVPTPDPTLLRLQASLNAQGYDCGPADGLLGTRTTACLAAFYWDAGVTRDTDYVQALRRSEARRLAPARPSVPQVAADPDAPLPSEVEAVQRFLLARAFPVGGADGVMGPRTRRAIAAYEAFRGRSRTGEFSPWLRGEVGLPERPPAQSISDGGIDGFAHVRTISGTARVVDGDGLYVDRIEVRLQGIAAPEDGPQNREPGGQDATAALRLLAEAKPVTCYLDGTETYGREVGRCVVDGIELGGAMVRAGHARDCPRFSGGDYAAAEREARALGRDLSAIYDLPGYCRQ